MAEDTRTEPAEVEKLASEVFKGPRHTARSHKDSVTLTQTHIDVIRAVLSTRYKNKMVTFMDSSTSRFDEYLIEGGLVLDDRTRGYDRIQVSHESPEGLKKLKTLFAL